MELGVRVRLRDSDTLDDLVEVSAPGPVESGDVVASVQARVDRVSAMRQALR